MEKTEVLGAFFASVFTSKTGLRESQAPETRGKVWKEKDFPLVEDDQAREHFNKLDIRKSMVPEGLQPQALKELADAIARLLLIVSEQSW